MRKLIALALALLPTLASAQSTNQTLGTDFGNAALSTGACPSGGTNICSTTPAIGVNTREIATMASLISGTRPQISAQVSADTSSGAGACSTGIVSGTPCQIIWNLADVDTAGGLNTSTGSYAVATPGTYVFCATVTFQYTPTFTPANAIVQILKNGSVVATTRDSYPVLTNLQAAKTICRMATFALNDLLTTNILMIGNAFVIKGSTTGITTFYGARIGP